MDLSLYDHSKFDRGRSRMLWALWLIASAVLFERFFPGSGWRRTLLRMFGAHVGEAVIIKPHVRIKFPWRLSIGNHCWIGENSWIDNVVEVSIGANSCISQGVYLCTGSHDATSESFAWIARPIAIADQVWIGAFARVGPGVTIGQGSQVAMATVVARDVERWSVITGNPSRRIGTRHELKRLESAA